MAQYIDKETLENILRRLWKEDDNKNSEHRICYNKALQEVQCQIDAIELKDMDLYEAKIGETQIYIEDDGGEPPYGGKQWLDLGCLEYEIPKDNFKDGDNVEVIIRKIQKGE